MRTDTIAAIATALSDSGIGIVRISGSEAIEIADKVYVSKSGKKHLRDVDSHTIHYGFIADHGETVDEVMVSVMRAPGSYTAEDTVEINCHGGVLVVNRVLEAVLAAGARMAEPGEFTRRAFLNGRMDLSEAEAVIDIIHAKSELALKSSVRQLKGSLSEKIKSLRAAIIYEIAFIESALDDPEHISLEGYPERLAGIVKDLITQIDRLLSTADDGRILREGIKTVIVGKPNVGKSSFLNLLLGEDKAIVTDIAGTTRDVLEEHIRLGGISLNITDTAGIRPAEDAVEKIGVRKAKESAADADLILYVVDSSAPLDDNDSEVADMIGARKCIVLLNKTDLSPAVKEEDIHKLFDGHCVEPAPIIKTSTKDGTGVEELEKTLKEMFFRGELSFDNEVVLTNMRHKQALQDTRDALSMVEKSIADNLPEDFYSIDLMSAYTALGTVIGEEVSDDLVDEIFSKFCMGK